MSETAQVPLVERYLHERIAKLEAKYDGWLPTADNINALPEGIKNYIYHLETNSDIATTIREHILFKDERRALSERVVELEAGALASEKKRKDYLVFLEKHHLKTEFLSGSAWGEHLEDKAGG